MRFKKPMYLHRKKPIPINPNSLFVGSSNPKPSIFTGCLPPPVILREAEGEVAESKSLRAERPVSEVE
jgi:hypothetical protein